MMLSVFFFAQSGDRDVAYRSLELNQRMGAVVARSRQSFTVGAEICVMAYCALITITGDVGLIAFSGAERTIAVNAIVALRSCWRTSNRLKERRKSMPWVRGGC